MIFGITLMKAERLQKLATMSFWCSKGTKMNFETTGLLVDTREVFFSDKFYYAASTRARHSGKPAFVGCGCTKDEAIRDMRLLAGSPGQPKSKGHGGQAETIPELDERVTLNEIQRRQLGEKTKAMRQARGLSQMQVANQALGFAKSHALVSRIERQELRGISRRTLAALAAFWDLPVLALVSLKAQG